MNKLQFLIIACFAFISANGQLDISVLESNYYKIVEVPIPKEISLEVGGLAF